MIPYMYTLLSLLYLKKPLTFSIYKAVHDIPRITEIFYAT